ncbi:Peptidase C1A papain C-terminal domain-containing protein [Caenorhabditis elegans]|uniref:Peptidase C1A papain C-terminal domain-containing protein n=1 Tax=Caenorhabditis elegans TaxID=6239 RepID=O45466_CAEEL|nr:Peptidase C1A papain C-terminal domain-containing protein [Caenorhabditis elegans]CAB04322.3 Peptidase C1A papain C-terminal domain-containing protein [Caenorhabditis elegans]|eukprot:NP_507186.3 Cysteine PRotease related [Caenorhabditis elegans]
MNLILLSSLFVITFAFAPIRPIPEELTGQDLVDHINSAASTFQTENYAVTHEKMHTRSMHEKFNAPFPDEFRATEREFVLDATPLNFDARTRWPQCKSMKLIREQSNCGSCWAFSTAEVISDRTCIASNGTQQPIISPTDLLTCCGMSCGEGCDGGFPYRAFQWWARRGVVTGGDYLGTGCKPYPIRPCNSDNCVNLQTPPCRLSCQPGYRTTYTNDKNYGNSAYPVPRTVAAIQADIYYNGPVVAAFIVYEDFEKYKSGIYRHIAGRSKGGHAVKLIGWGTERGTPYWLAVNSWGSQWGESGTFRILRGVDECGIESRIVAGLPR